MKHNYMLVHKCGFRSTAPESTTALEMQVRVQGAGRRSRVQGAGCRVQGAGCRVQGEGCRVRVYAGGVTGILG